MILWRDRRRTVGLVVSLAAVAAAVPVGAATATTSPGGWHVFVYIVNDSEGQLPYGQDIEEMVEASRSGVEFTVYLDSSATAGPALSTSLVPNVDDALLLEVAGGAVSVTQRLGELDSGEPDTLAWFVAQGLLAHPSDRNALVVWDHGAGWNGVAVDEDVTVNGSRRSSSLDSNDIATALERGLAAGGRDQLDLVVFDACLMASIDTLGAVHGHADYLIASEEVIPGLGLDYNGFAALAQPGIAPPAIFDAVASTYVSEVADAQPSDAQAFTLSMFDVNQTDAVSAALTEFAAAAAADVVVNPAPYLQSAAALRKYGVSGDFWFGFIDLGEFLNGLAGVSPDVAAARDRLLAAVSAARVGQRNGTPAFDAATGLTVYFPNAPREFDARFEALRTSPLWFPFLTAYYDAQAGVVLQTDVGFAAENLSVGVYTDDSRYYVISAPVTSSFTGSVELVAATTDASGVRTYFESDSGDVVDGQASAYIYPTLTTVTDGLRSVVPFTRYMWQPDGQHGYSTFTLHRANGSVAQLNWDRTVGQGPFTAVDGSGVVTAYTPQPGDLAYPVHLVQPPGGTPAGVTGTDPLDPNRVWTVRDEPLPAGTEVYVELRLLDANGDIVDTIAGILTAGQ